eukprot:scaffold17595_cov113-Cylindrotheca_fusiformis.AAC.11
MDTSTPVTIGVRRKFVTRFIERHRSAILCVLAVMDYGASPISLHKMTDRVSILFFVRQRRRTI